MSINNWLSMYFFRNNCKVFFIRHMNSHVLFWGHWYPSFGFLLTSPLGFKARVGSALFELWRQV